MYICAMCSGQTNITTWRRKSENKKVEGQGGVDESIEFGYGFFLWVMVCKYFRLRKKCTSKIKKNKLRNKSEQTR